MAAHLQHGVRQAEKERSRHRHGGALSPQTSRVVALRVADLAVQQRGGLEHFSGLEAAMLKDFAFCDCIVDLGIEELERRGTVVDAEGNPLPILKALATFMNTKRLHGVALGLQRPVRAVPALADYLQARSGAADAPSAPVCSDNGSFNQPAPAPAEAQPPRGAGAPARGEDEDDTDH